MKVLKKAALLIAAAGITFAVIVVSIIVYQYTAMTPELPNEDDCELHQLVQTEDNAAEIHHYQCQRGAQKQWQGHELWLLEPANDKWQRMMTTQSPSCINLVMESRRLRVIHDGDRLEMNLAEPVFLYHTQAGKSESVAVAIDKQATANCES